MRVIYIDSLFLLELLLDYLTLLLAGRISGAVIRRRRLGLGALAGALYTVFIVWTGWAVLRDPILRLGVGLLMVAISYGVNKKTPRTYLMFLAAAAGAGGVIYALSYLGAGLELVKGVPVPVIDLKLVILGGVAAYAILSLICRKRVHAGPKMYRKVEIWLDGKRALLTALVDNGNALTDPVTGAPVIVAEGALLEAFLPPGTDLRHPADCFPRLPMPQRFKLLPYRAVGVEQGILLAIKADRVVVEGRECEHRLVALSPTPVSDGSYQALLYSD